MNNCGVNFLIKSVKFDIDVWILIINDIFPREFLEIIQK